MSNKYNPGSNITPQNQLIKWLNDAGLAEGGKRAELLRKVNELLLHQCSAMLPEYIENILSYVSDKNTDVKKQVIAFVEEISKQNPKYLPKVIGNLRLFIIDTTIAVQKRAIQAASIVYRNTLIWICKKEASISDMQFVWQHLSELKLIVLNMIDSDNEGIRTHSIKFLEEVVLTQSSGDGESEFCLDSLPSLPFINRKALEEEAEHIFTLLVKFHNSQHISSVNLMACMTTLCLVARERPRYAPRVLRALADLHTTLPPTLSASQVNSVRKHLKMLLLNFLKQPSAGDLTLQVTQLLTDAGVSAHEINRAAPRRNKRLALARIDNGDATKRFRVDSPQSNSQGSDSNSRGDFPTQEDDIPLPIPVPAPVPAPVPVPVPPPSSIPLPGALSIPLPGATSISTPVTAPVPAPIPGALAPTEDTLMEGLDNVEKVIDLVMATLLKNLPSQMPDDFMTAYSPIPNSGSKAQKKSLAKKLICLVNQEPGSVLPMSEDKIPLLKDDEEKLTLKNAVAKLQESTRADRRVESAVSKLMEETRQDYLKEEERRNKEKEKVPPPQTPTVPKLKQKVKLLRLQEITRPIPKEVKERLILGAIRRILNAERDATIGGAAHVRAKFVALFAAGYTPEIRDLVLDHILEAPLERLDLAMAWLYEEYAFMQGFNRHPVTLQPKLREKHDQNYNQLLCALVTQIYERSDPDMDTTREALLRRIYAEAPIITEEASEYLRHFGSRRAGAPGTNTAGAALALEILDELCATRPLHAHKLAPHALVQILSEDEQTRELALSTAVRLYSRCTAQAHSKLRKVIEKHALLFLGFITLSSPPPELEAARPRQPWTDELYKICIALVMALFPHNEDLIVEVGRVYGCASPEAKRCILRASEAPLRSAVMRAQAAGGGGWPEAFTALMDECPRGSETLLTRLVHIITEREPPSAELMARVRELYQSRVSDVRFLIPVLTGLAKSEILAALPKLIKLNPAVVKEVFNKLLGIQNPGEEKPPVSPSDLLVELHLIDPATADLKYIIKATALCFAEKNIYTQDVVTGVLQQLAEERAVPVLMMRSVLQALTLYPALAPFVLNLLQLLVEKEVWTHKVAWEGWVKCCERLVPRSVSLLVALPPRALHAISPALMASLRAHLATLSPPEQALLPTHVAAVMAPPAPAPAPPLQQEPPPFTPPPSHNLLEPLPPGME